MYHVANKGERNLVISVKCPKCGKIETHIMDEADLREIRLVGISRIGFIHGEHTLIVSFDATGFVRGAYIVPSDRIPTNIRVFYNDFRILSYPQFPMKNFELIIVDMGRKILDIRLSRLRGTEIANLVKSLEDYTSILKGTLRRLGVSGRAFNILSSGSLIIIFYNIPSKIMKFLAQYIADGYNPYSIYYAIRYLKAKGADSVELDDTRKRAETIINAHKYVIKPKKGINAIRYARASILALWPELAGSFDELISFLRSQSDEGVSLLKILVKVPNIDIDSLLNMLRELKKRDLLEIERT